MMAHKMSRRAVMGWLSAATVLGSSAARGQPATPPLPGDAEAVTWLRRNAQALPSFDPAPAALQPLVQALAGAHVVGIGEATDGSYEDQACKAAIIRALIAGGAVRVLAVEGDRRAAIRLNDYVRGGGPDPVATLQGERFTQGWQSEEFIGLIAWIRAWNLAGRPAVRIVSVDVSALGEDANQALRYIQTYLTRFAEPFDMALAPLVRESAMRERSAAEAARYLSPRQWDAARQALTQMQAIIAASTSPGKDQAGRAAASAVRAMSFARPGTAGAAPTGGDIALRERLLAESLVEQIRTDRAVLWGHNLSVVANSGVGAQLRRALGERYRAVVFDYERGSVRIKPSEPGAAPPPDDAAWRTTDRASGPVGALLGRAGPDVYWCNLKAMSDLAPAALAGGGDLLVFIRQITPSRLYPFVPQS